MAVKPVQDRFASEAVSAEKPQLHVEPSKSTKTAEATLPTGGVVATVPAQ
jgi:hypothetical protein